MESIRSRIMNLKNLFTQKLRERAFELAIEEAKLIPQQITRHDLFFYAEEICEYIKNGEVPKDDKET